MEWASCGYLVVSLTHNDGSADYSPVEGAFNDKPGLWDYKHRNITIKIRENEMISVVNEITSHRWAKVLGTTWENVTLTKDLVLMGHSFGGMTALGASSKCP